MLVLGITVVQTIHDGVVAQELVIERSAGPSFYVEKKNYFDWRQNYCNYVCLLKEEKSRLI